MNSKTLAFPAGLSLLVLGIAVPVTAAQIAHGDLFVSTAFTPNPPSTKGTEKITVTVKDAAGKPVHGAIVKIRTSMPTMSMQGDALVAREVEAGVYAASMRLAYATTWAFDISVNADGRHSMTRVKKELR